LTVDYWQSPNQVLELDTSYISANLPENACIFLSDIPEVEENFYGSKIDKYSVIYSACPATCDTKTKAIKYITAEAAAARDLRVLAGEDDADKAEALLHVTYSDQYRTLRVYLGWRSMALVEKYIIVKLPNHIAQVSLSQDNGDYLAQTPDSYSLIRKSYVNLCGICGVIDTNLKFDHADWNDGKGLVLVCNGRTKKTDTETSIWACMLEANGGTYYQKGRIQVAANTGVVGRLDIKLLRNEKDFDDNQDDSDYSLDMDDFPQYDREGSRDSEEAGLCVVPTEAADADAATRRNRRLQGKNPEYRYYQNFKVFYTMAVPGSPSDPYATHVALMSATSFAILKAPTYKPEQYEKAEYIQFELYARPGMDDTNQSIRGYFPDQYAGITDPLEEDWSKLPNMYSASLNLGAGVIDFVPLCGRHYASFYFEKSGSTKKIKWNLHKLNLKDKSWSTLLDTNLEISDMVSKHYPADAYAENALFAVRMNVELFSCSKNRNKVDPILAEARENDQKDRKSKETLWIDKKELVFDQELAERAKVNIDWKTQEWTDRKAIIQARVTQAEDKKDKSEKALAAKKV
jgi:hypothetical protein